MERDVDLRNYLRILRQRAALLIIVTGLIASLGLVVSLNHPPSYKASTTLLIEEAPDSASAPDYQSLLVSERRGRTYAQLLVTRPLLEQVRARLQLETSLEALRASIYVQPIRETQLIKVEASDSSPERAAGIANTLVSMFVEQMHQLQTARYSSSKETLQQQLALLEQEIERAQPGGGIGAEHPDLALSQQEQRLEHYRQNYASLLQSYEQVRLAELRASPGIVQIEPAIAPASPSSLPIWLSTLVIALAGLFITIVVVFLREAFDDTVKNADELAQQVGLPILGLIGHVQDNRKNRLVTVAQPRSPVAEAFRTLRTNIQFASVSHPIRSILVTSATPGDGKSSVLANLAIVLAQGGKQVAIVDADLRRPAQHHYHNLINTVGLSDFFVQQRQYLSMRGVSMDGISILTAGPLPPNPAELLGSEKMGKILSEVQEESELVLVDTPPITPVTDAVVLAPRVDAVLFVVRAGVTKLDRCQRALEQLRRAGANVIGVVINDMPSSSRFYGYGGNSYAVSYYAGAEAAEQERAGLFGRLLGRRRWRRGLQGWLKR